MYAEGITTTRPITTRTGRNDAKKWTDKAAWRQELFGPPTDRSDAAAYSLLRAVLWRRCRPVAKGVRRRRRVCQRPRPAACPLLERAGRLQPIRIIQAAYRVHSLFRTSL